MDTKITKKRLNDHLSYDWIKYVAIFAAALILFWFLYDVGAKKPTSAQNLEIYMINCSALSNKAEKFNEDLEARINGESVEDAGGRRVYHADQILEISVNNTFSNYSENAQTQQALSVKLMGGQESDLMVMDFNTFNTFVQSWLVSVDEYRIELENALKIYLTDELRQVPDVPSGSSDAAGIRRMLEKRLWLSIEEEYNKFFIQKSETDDEGNPVTRYEKYGYFHQKIIDEEGWQRLSEEYSSAIGALDQNAPDYQEKLDALVAEFEAEYDALEKEPMKNWGLDISKFDLTNVQSNWFDTAYPAYKLSPEDGETKGMFFALGISGFGYNNGTTYYELVKVFNFLIENYASAK